MGLYDRLVGEPWVYDHIRPLLTGGLDLSPAYDFGRDLSEEVVLDVGCGTGDALRYLEGFRSYDGFDPDDRAISSLQRRYTSPDVSAHARSLRPDDVTAIRPTLALMIGVLHHLDDEQVIETLDMLRTGRSIRQIRTLDPQYIPGDLRNNLFILLDRGRHVRSFESLQDLIARSKFTIADHFTFRPTIPLPSYLVMDLVPA